MTFTEPRRSQEICFNLPEIVSENNLNSSSKSVKPAIKPKPSLKSPTFVVKPRQHPPGQQKSKLRSSPALRKSPVQITRNVSARTVSVPRVKPRSHPEDKDLAGNLCSEESSTWYFFCFLSPFSVV